MPARGPAVALMAITALLGCSRTPSTSSNQAQPLNGLDSLRRAVLELVREPTCGAAGQCRAAAFGAKPCGGPWSYVVYSTGTADTVRLAQAVAAYNAEEARLNEALGRVSDCRAVVRPSVACREGRCMALP